MTNPTEDPAAAPTAAVKELFGLLLDAEEAKAEGDPEASELEALARAAQRAAPEGVRSAAECLLASHRRAKASLLVETFTAGGTPKRRGDTPELPVAPPQIAGYRVDGEIGRGGFGIVYRAEQLEPVQRTVAIKLLRTEFASRETAARFRAEAAVLARMSHEGIARVLDAGLDSIGRPFVVMELIDGLPLIAYCERKILSVRDRVWLMIRVCDVVHHAHQRAVIHRDLKPANVLIEEVDGRPRPRVIDFGIAKLLEDRANDTLTRDGARIGTPRYMSPEQLRGADTADIRIDVYALGVLLCEALTGEVPYAVSEGDDGSASRRTTTRGTRPSALAAGAGGPIASRARELKGDLDRIVLKAVAPEPALRYTSAAALAEDLRRYLAGKPVDATPPGVFYLARKFVARRKGISAALLLAAGSISFGAAALVIGLEKARENTETVTQLLEESEKERAQADAVAKFLLRDVLESLSPSVTGRGEPRVRDVLRRASAVSRETLADQPELQVDLLQRVGVAQRTLSDFAGAAESFAAAAEIGTSHGVLSTADTLQLRIDSILAKMSARQFDGLVSAIRSVETDATSGLGEDHPTTLRARLHAAHIISGAEAVNSLREVVRSMETEGLMTDPVYLEGLQFLGAALAASGHDDAIPTLERAVERSIAMYGRTHVATLEMQLRLGEALFAMGRITDAEPVLLEVKDRALRGFGSGHIIMNRALQFLARLTLREGRYAEAHVHSLDLLETIRDRELEESPQHAICLELLGDAEVGIGYFNDASRTYRRAIEIREVIGDGTTEEAMKNRARRGAVMLELDQPADLIEVVLPIFEHTEPGDEIRVQATFTLADAYLRLYRQDDAHELIEKELQRLPVGSPYEARFNAWLIDNAGD